MTPRFLPSAPGRNRTCDLRFGKPVQLDGAGASCEIVGIRSSRPSFAKASKRDRDQVSKMGRAPRPSLGRAKGCLATERFTFAEKRLQVLK
jgi:hypothetical protein